jgi:hypothetical protein
MCTNIIPATTFFISASPLLPFPLSSLSYDKKYNDFLGNKYILKIE